MGTKENLAAVVAAMGKTQSVGLEAREKIRAEEQENKKDPKIRIEPTAK